VGNKQYGGVRQYIPLKVNAANVMPIIFAQAIMFIPIAIVGFRPDGTNAFMQAFMDNNGFWYNLVFAVLIIAFTYFYTAVIINPVQMAENLKLNNGFIPGVKPGKKTAEYIDEIMSRITLPGSILLAIIAVLPAFARLFGVSQRGFLRPGYRADLVLVRPGRAWTVTADCIMSKCGWSPMEGHIFLWQVERTICNGHTVYQHGRVDDRYIGEPINFQH
jgi:hypothetical protein